MEEQKTKLLQQEEDKKIQLAKLEEILLEVKLSCAAFAGLIQDFRILKHWMLKYGSDVVWTVLPLGVQSYIFFLTIMSFCEILQTPKYCFLLSYFLN